MKKLKPASNKANPKKKKVNPIADQGVLAYLHFDDAKTAIAFYKKAFGAKLRFPPMKMGSKIGHAEMEIGTGLLLLADAFPDSPPNSKSGKLMFYVPDIDKSHKKAIKAGAKSIEEPKDQFWGDRMGVLRDPFGITWLMATHIEDVTPAEMAKRMKAFST